MLNCVTRNEQPVTRNYLCFKTEGLVNKFVYLLGDFFEFFPFVRVTRCRLRVTILIGQKVYVQMVNDLPSTTTYIDLESIPRIFYAKFFCDFRNS